MKNFSGRVFPVVILMLCLSSCGGGGGGGDGVGASPAQPPPSGNVPAQPTSLTLSGVVSKGRVSDATVKVYEVTDTGEKLLGETTTNGQGQYSLAVSLDGGAALRVEATTQTARSTPMILCDRIAGCGNFGNYTSVDTSKLDLNQDGLINFGESYPAPQDLALTAVAYVPATDQPVGINVTPLTHLVSEYVGQSNDYSRTHIEAVTAQVAGMFGLGNDMVSLTPANLASPDSNSREEVRYGLVLAAIAGGVDTPHTDEDAVRNLTKLFLGDGGTMPIYSSNHVVDPMSLEAILGRMHLAAASLAASSNVSGQARTYLSEERDRASALEDAATGLPDNTMARQSSSASQLALDDYDGDGLTDSFEEKYGLNPFDPSDASADPDGDGLTNLQEQSAGTDPNAKDTDQDGLDDGAEIALGTDPNNPDTDGDFILDGAEVAAGTDPLVPNPGKKSFFVLNSPPGANLGGGQGKILSIISHYSVDIQTDSSNVPRVLHLSVTDENGVSVADFHIAAPMSKALMPGNYDRATRYPGNSTALPGLQVSYRSLECNLVDGRFVLYSLEVSDGGDVTSAAFDFKLSCDGSATVSGGVRLNSDVPYPYDLPHADAGQDVVVSPGDDVALLASDSTTDSTPTYTWTQVAGPAVTLSDSHGVAPEFTAPIPGGDSSDLVFDLTVTDQQGRSDTDEVVVTVSKPRSEIFWDPKAPEFVSFGRKLTANENSGAFHVDKNANANMVHVQYDGVPNVDYQFSAPFDQPLKPGLYPYAARLRQVQGSGTPGMSVSSDGHACSIVDGYFIVREYKLAADGSLAAAAIDFVQACLEGGGTPLYLHGYIRYHSKVPLFVDDPVSYAGEDAIITEGDQFTLDGTGSIPVGAKISSYQWRQVSGPTVNLQSADQATATFVSPAVDPGGADLVFELTVTDADGRVSTSTTKIHVRDPSDPQDAILLDDPDGWLTHGLHLLYEDATDVTMTSGVEHPDFLRLVRTNGILPTTILLSAPGGGSLSPGKFKDVRTYTSQLPGSIGMDLSVFSLACVPQDGQLSIYDVGVSNGVVQRLAMDFEVTCYGVTDPVIGFVRFNSSVPLIREVPDAFAQSAKLVTELSQVTLDGKASIAYYAGIAGYHWQQTSGPSVSIDNADAAVANFVAPDVDPGGADLGFRLTVTDNNGAQDTDDVSMHVRDTNDPQSILRVKASTGEPLTHGIDTTYDVNNTYFSASVTNERSLEVRANSRGSFDIAFTVPAGEVLMPGSYDVPVSYDDSAGDLLVTDDDTSCTDGHASFDIEELDISGSAVNKFAAEFELHCQNSDVPLVGSVRINSAVPLP